MAIYFRFENKVLCPRDSSLPVIRLPLTNSKGRIILRDGSFKKDEKDEVTTD